MMFELDRLERESRLPTEEIEGLRNEVRKDFPRDDLLFELHMVRALRKVIRDRSEPAKAPGRRQ